MNSINDVTNKNHFEVQTHPTHKRLRHLELNRVAVNQFFESVNDVLVQKIEYVPFMRFHLAQKLLETMGHSFKDTIREILHDRSTGGFTIGTQDQSFHTDDYVKLSTALSHLVGVPNFDGMSGKYYARISVKHSFDSDTYLRQAYRTFYLHTDGTFVNEKTDWILMMKLDEQHAVGGESLLLHLDDWEDLDRFRNHPLAYRVYKFSQKGRKSKNIDEEVYATTFFEYQNAPGIRFNDQCSQPSNIEEGLYHKAISDSLSSAKESVSLTLPVGHTIMLNNNFWLHGREAFEENTELYRELLRQRGHFARV